VHGHERTDKAHNKHLVLLEITHTHGMIPPIAGCQKLCADHIELFQDVVRGSIDALRQVKVEVPVRHNRHECHLLCERISPAVTGPIHPVSPSRSPGMSSSSSSKAGIRTGIMYLPHCTACSNSRLHETSDEKNENRMH
jgi:hypothetical protein